MNHHHKVVSGVSVQSTATIRNSSCSGNYSSIQRGNEVPSGDTTITAASGDPTITVHTGDTTVSLQTGDTTESLSSSGTIVSLPT